MIDRHWDGIAAYCHPEHKISLGFVEPETDPYKSWKTQQFQVALWRQISNTLKLFLLHEKIDIPKESNVIANLNVYRRWKLFFDNSDSVAS